MSAVHGGSQSPAAMAAAAAPDSSKHWAPHSPLLIGCVVGINVFMIALIFFYFWRFFSGKRGPASPGGAGGDEEAGSSADNSPASSPRAFRGARGLGHRQDLEDIASSLPVSVYSSAEEPAADGGEGKPAAECAVCIVEFRDGDLARLLPRCGHRFHADCVGAWLQLHATCPLCRAGVVATAAASEATNPKDDVDGAAAV